MEKTVRMLMISFLVTISVFMFTPTASQALTDAEIKAKTHIVNLEARPVWFRPGAPIDFVAAIKYDGGTQDGFDIGVFHEGRLVGWQMNQRLNTGMNTFKLRDANFRGDPGDYIVKVRFKGNVFTEKKFATRSHAITTYIFTIDPKAQPPAPSAPPAPSKK